MHSSRVEPNPHGVAFSHLIHDLNARPHPGAGLRYRMRLPCRMGFPGDPLNPGLSQPDTRFSSATGRAVPYLVAIIDRKTGSSVRKERVSCRVRPMENCLPKKRPGVRTTSAQTTRPCRTSALLAIGSRSSRQSDAVRLILIPHRRATPGRLARDRFVRQAFAQSHRKTLHWPCPLPFRQTMPGKRCQNPVDAVPKSVLPDRRQTV